MAMMGAMAEARRALLAFGAASLGAVLLGGVTCALSDVPAALWARNLAAWVVGAAAAWALARRAGRRALYVAIAAAPLGLAATLVNPDLEGVHRWLVAGPVRFNAAMLLLPSFVVAIAFVAERVRWWWAPTLAALGLLILQPDASQATALTATSCVLALGLPKMPLAGRTLLSLAAVAMAAMAWMRPDPLEPVPEVEQIISLARDHSIVLAGGAVVCLALSAAAPLLAAGRGDPSQRRAALALAVLTAVWALAPALGAFPAPLVGVGLSPILGLWLGVGLLAMRR